MDHPQAIGKYRLDKFLGGGMSHVFLATDTVIGRPVAVKILTPAGAADADTKARFLREAQLAGGLSHVNVMSVYDFGEDQGAPFMVMEYLRGEDLRSAIKNGRAGDLLNILKMASQIARGLGYIHSQRIIHRDIKPENIHVGEDGNLKLMDFGIAKTKDLNLTQAGYTMGTPYYMSPEQVLGKDVTHLVDIYSFGILFYEMLLGSTPIRAETVEQLFYAILNVPIDLDPLARAGVPERIRTIIGRCVAKNPQERPQDFDEVRREIEAAIADIERPPAPAVEPPPPPPPKSSARWLIPAAAGAVVLIVVAYFAFRPREQAAPAPQKPAPPAAVLSTPTGEMVLVPAGQFLAGKDKAPASLPDYYIDKTKVTTAAYGRFCREKGRPLPAGFPEDKPGLPAVSITFTDAQAFCGWAGKRLPTGLEWEKAARGTDGRAYPWGDQRDPQRANVADNPSLSEHVLAPVQSFTNGASPYGALQMAGNAFEFTDAMRPPSPGAISAFSKLLTPPPTAEEPWYEMRGGAYDIPLVENVTWEWGNVPARYKAPDIGFRCAKDVK
jgi:eukaryotic-like serine/threonine-protein kinase